MMSPNAFHISHPRPRLLPREPHPSGREGEQPQRTKRTKGADDLGDSGAPNWNWQDIILLKPSEDLGARLRAGVRATEDDEGMWAEYAPQYSKMLEEAAKDPHKRDTGWMTRTRPITLASGRILIGLGIVYLHPKQIPSLNPFWHGLLT